MAFLEIQGCAGGDSAGSVQVLPSQTSPPFPSPHLFFHQSPDPSLFLTSIHSSFFEWSLHLH